MWAPVPSFCRHNRFIQNCPICREPEPPRARPKRSGSSSSRSSARSTRSASAGVKVRRVARAVDDGYRNALVPGLRSTDDARRLAEEIGFAAGRLAELESDPPGLYAEAALEPDREEGLWLAVLIAVLGPLGGDGDDPFAGIRAARVPWAGGEIPPLEGVPLGPRGGATDAATGERALAGYRAWAERGGGQETALRGDAGWSPARRFGRAYERLGALPGFSRPARYDLLVVLGRLGLMELEPDGVHLGESDDASLAARRVFGIADRFLLERRAGDLADAAEVPLEALDLALANFGSEAGRITQGASAEAADADAYERAAAALDV